jgi:hypothetical protein
MRTFSHFFINATKQGKRILWSLKIKVKTIEGSDKRINKM